MNHSWLMSNMLKYHINYGLDSKVLILFFSHLTAFVDKYVPRLLITYKNIINWTRYFMFRYLCTILLGRLSAFYVNPQNRHKNKKINLTPQKKWVARHSIPWSLEFATSANGTGGRSPIRLQVQASSSNDIWYMSIFLFQSNNEKSSLEIRLEIVRMWLTLTLLQCIHRIFFYSVFFLSVSIYNFIYWLKYECKYIFRHS